MSHGWGGCGGSGAGASTCGSSFSSQELEELALRRDESDDRLDVAVGMKLELLGVPFVGGLSMPHRFAEAPKPGSVALSFAPEVGGSIAHSISAEIYPVVSSVFWTEDGFHLRFSSDENLNFVMNTLEFFSEDLDGVDACYDGRGPCLFTFLQKDNELIISVKNIPGNTKQLAALQCLELLRDGKYIHSDNYNDFSSVARDGWIGVDLARNF